MSDNAINNLQQAVKQAAPGPFALDSTFLVKGLNDPEVKVPADYDTILVKAFQLKDAASFLVEVAAENVGPVVDNSFTVTNATIPFLSSTPLPLKSMATLVFAVTADANPTLVVQIATSPSNWTWTNSFEFMGGWPFNQLTGLLNPLFVFSTADGKYPWTNSSGLKVEGGAKQNFSTNLPLPPVVQPFLTLFNGLQAPATLALAGVLDLSAYDATNVLLPSGTLAATLQNGQFKVFYLTVSNPSMAVTIPPQAAPEDDSGQSPLLSLSALLGVGNIPPEQSPYIFQVQISSSQTQGVVDYSIGLNAVSAEQALTPDAIVQLIGGGGTYFSGAPAVLQQFLAFVGLQGMTMAGTLNPLTIGQISILIGSTGGSWTPIPNPPPGLDFTIQNFSLQWTMLNPLDAPTRQQTFLFETEFTLLTSVFKGPGGEGDGIFTVQFDSDLNFTAAFAGTAKLSDFLSTVSGGIVSLPSTIEATLSDITLNVNYSAKSFGFSSAYTIELSFLKVGGEDILSISDGNVNISALTPPQQPQGSKSVWQASVGGLLGVGPFKANVVVAYDGTVQPSLWNLSATLAQPLSLTDLIKQFFSAGGTYNFPAFLPGTITINTFAITAVIPTGTSGPAVKNSYTIDVGFVWDFMLGEQHLILNSKIGLKYDGQNFSGAVATTWTYTAINLELGLTYKFEKTSTGSNQTLTLTWQGFTASYTTGKNEIVFSVKGWSLGSLIQALVRTLGNPYFVLPAPWDLLNQVSLDGLSIIVSLQSGLQFTQRLSATYTLSQPLNLGFVIIKSLTFRRDTTGKVTLAIDGTSPISSQLGDLMNPAKGQDVQNMPSVPGRGNQYFKVFLLALGQRIGISGHANFPNTQAVITALQNVPSTTGKLNPVNPTQGIDGQPYYNQSNNWLIAGHLGLLQVAGVWTVDAMVVFNDPDLYGLRLALAGAKAGGLAGLAIDILYKKITDDVGLFQINFTFPDSIRNINMGAVSITLPQIGIQVYTNGDFLIDIGFPYNLDFRRSFALYAIVYGVPVMGAGGFYFGKLSSATATQVPKTDAGTFQPVIVFGVGLQLGLGYNFSKGPLTAGFALTVFGIVEGVIAAWHPYSGQTQKSLTPLGDALQSQYYFKLSGTVGVIGLLYGKVDFAIVQASINVKIVLSVQITYESYRAIPLTATASVSVSVTVKIDLGLFSISISFSFSMTVSAQFVIGSNTTAPWDSHSLQAHVAAIPLQAGPEVLARHAAALRPKMKRVARHEDVSPPTLKLLASPQFTVLAPEGATAYTQQQGAFVFLGAMDAPTAAAPSTGDTSFDHLCAAFFPWVIDVFKHPKGNTVHLDQISETTVTRDELESYVYKLADLANPPLNITGLLGFLASGFILNIETPDYANSSGDKLLFQKGSAVFPMFDGLSLTIPDPAGGSGTKPIAFETYATANSAYRQAISDIFKQVEATIEAQNKAPQLKFRNALDDAESMAALIFVDYFTMMGRQLLQAARNLLDGFPWKLGAQDSISGILLSVNAIPGNALTVSDIAVPNQDHPLSPLPIQIPRLNYAIQANDTLAGIAAKYSDPASPPRWTTRPAQLIYDANDPNQFNGRARFLQPNISIQFTFSPDPYVTQPGDSFESIADWFQISLQELSQQSVLYNLAGLLTPAAQMQIPAITYTTASSDTLRGVSTQFATTVPLLADASRDVAGLFSTTAENGVITLAHLVAWTVAGLWTAIGTTEQVAQTAGMISRFLMFGLRLPTAAGLTLSDKFLFPTNQSAYAMYQLTGQEFPTSAPQTVTDFQVTITAATSSHGVNLSFIQFDGAPGNSAQLQLTTAYNNLSTVLKWAQAGNFQPSPGFAVVPQSLPQAKGFAANNFSFWVTSDLAGLRALTLRTPPASSLADSSSGQAQPTLWPLPSSLLSLTEARQAALSELFTNMPQILPLLPQFQPQRGQTSPASQQTAWSNLTNWAWTTRVDFQIKRLPVSGFSSLGVGDTPQGPASIPVLPNVYEVVGATTVGVQTLELLLRSMDSLGENIVSGLFLLYPQSGTTVSLATLGAQEFLAFLTQTNLSTETNPVRSLFLARALAGAPPRGIGNSPGEFIKLLWELSIVRSGGYYLFYQVIDGGGGLPASVFDANGVATLSMVATFAAQGAHSFGNTAPAFVNSFVTTDNLNTATDVVQLLSLSTSGQSAALTGSATETLASLSALYGAGPGALAEKNATGPLSQGVVIPVNDIVRQLTQADLTDPSKTLDNLAQYYSQGAQTPITGAQIQSHNPGVPVALASVFYIPPIGYVVSNTSAPGNTFGSMSRYYALTLDAMAINALNVGRIFPQSATLNIDTQVFDLRSRLGPGNVSFDLTRDNYGPPPDNPADPNYARNFMYSLYNTLSAGLLHNAFFSPDSPMGLPFGPQVDDDTSTQDAFSSPVRLAHKRRALLANAVLDPFEYSQSLGIGNFAQVNPAPKLNPKDPDDKGLPPQSDNPYIGVGSTSQIALRWQDVFGNTTITPFTQPPASYTGALNGSAIVIWYSDRLIGLSSWINTMPNYIYSGAAGSPVLNLNLKLDSKPYEGGNPDLAKHDLARYQQIYFQLSQDYKDLGVPGITGNAVTMSLLNSLTGLVSTPLTPDQAKKIRDYVKQCVRYLFEIVNPGSLVPPPPLPDVSVQIPVSVNDVTSGNIIPLDATLTFSRHPLLTDPTVAALAEGLTASGAILPRPDAGTVPGEAPAYVGFATALETAFQTNDWYMKTGEGVKLVSDADDNGTALQLWAVRFGKSSGKGIYFQITENAPSYYTPKPIATTLASRTVQIIDYTTGNPITATFNGVDQNQWFQTCLDAIDSFLSATDSTSAFILDKLLGVDDPLKDGYLGKVLQAKESLADSISSAALPILSTSLGDSSTQWAAKEKLRQQLLNQIGAAYAAGAAVVYNLTNVSGAPPFNPAGPPNLYGQPVGTVLGATENENENFTLTAARIPLGPTVVGPNTYAPRLPFVFTTKNIATQAYVPLSLTLDITHLEFNRTNVPGIDGYVQSEWLVFVNGPFEYTLSTGATPADIPVVNRNLPTPPTVQEQLAKQPSTPPVEPVDLTHWSYSFEYLYRFAAQDTVQTTIMLNLPSTGPGVAAFAAGPDLFTALAQFVTAYPAISADFAAYLRKINAETKEPQDHATIVGAQKAVNAFQQYVNDVAVAYAASLRNVPAFLAAVPQLVKITFETVLDQQPETDNARINLLDLKINDIAATWNSATNTISNGRITLPAPVVMIAPDQYKAVVPPNPPAYPAYVYQKIGVEPPVYLPYSDALNNPMRTVAIPDLDVLLYQNGWASISIDRNKILFPVDAPITTNPAFVFHTPEVSFADPVVPRLVYPSFSLDQGQNPGNTLEQLLNAFFAGLFEGGDGTILVGTGITGSYSYEISSGFPIHLPVCLLPPVDTQVNPGVSPVFTPVVADAVDSWIIREHPIRTGNAQIGFLLTIFGGEEKQPLLVVTDLFHAVSAS